MDEAKRGNFWQGVHIVMSRVVFKPRKGVSPFKTVRNRLKWRIKALAVAVEKKGTQNRVSTQFGFATKSIFVRMPQTFLTVPIYAAFRKVRI